jgi:hypothetical protein
MGGFAMRHGDLMGVHGRPVKSGDWTLLGAAVGLAGHSFSLGHSLEDFLQPPALAPIPLRASLKEGFDAAWVRARIPRLFGFPPDYAEGDKSVFHEGFVAVTPDLAVGYPFVFTDYYACSRLMFSDEGPAPEIKGEIAAAFWSALLESPDDLEDFEITIHHFPWPGAMVLGCSAGRVYQGEA